jgi:hypothetical protein
MLAIGRVFSGASATISITTVAAGGISAAGAEYSGVSALVDKFASAVGASGTTAATGATGTTTVANELFVCAVGSRGTNGVTFSAPGDGFAIVGQDKSSLNTSGDRSVALLEKIVSATTTASPTLTISASNVWVAQVATLEETPAAGGGGMIRNPGMNAGINA